jgi:predicted TIM-barrel fold metal-dependent hydrolase
MTRGASTRAEDGDLAPCLASAKPQGGWLANGPMPALDDEDGARLPADLPPVVDAHVHLFPDAVFEAIWTWFDAHGWPVRHRLTSPAVIEFLLSRGVSRIVALHYAHRPGMARALNAYVAGLAAREPRVTALATVLPGEPDARAILEEAFALGLAGVKLHCHVQCLAPDDAAMMEAFEVCVAHDKPVVLHAGREPKSPAYRCDPHAICSAERVERVLATFPRLRLCVPHLGADEFDAYRRLLERHDNLWLDTTMVVADYFPGAAPVELLQARPERILYGTDFPNLPYAWDREVRRIAKLGLGPDALELVLGGSARALFRCTEA